VLHNDHPQSVRYVFYRMTDPRLPEFVEKSNRGYRQVQYRVAILRRAERLPYGWITDATRRGYHVPTFANRAEFIREMARYYRADLWKQSDYYCEVWVESRSIAGVIESVCKDLAVSLYPAGGFTSITLAYQAAEHVNRKTYDGEFVKPAVILFIGDYDPAGILIDVSVERELRKHLDDDVELEFKRIAITEEQISYYDLPTKPRKESDRRSLHIKETVETEAMPAGILRELLRNEIEALLPENALAVTRIAEESEREGLKMLASIADARARRLRRDQE
jgi:hypothetical protein